MKTTYNDVLPGFEGADVVAVVGVVHLPQDGNHASHEAALKEEERTIQDSPGYPMTAQDEDSLDSG